MDGKGGGTHYKSFREGDKPAGTITERANLNSLGEMAVKHEFKVTLSSDEEGFLSKQCPACRKRYKVKLEGEGEHSLKHCPYCGSESASGWKGWLTVEQEKYVEATAIGHATGLAEKMLDDAFRGLKSFSVKRTSSSRRAAPQKPVESNEPMPIFVSQCCDEPVKHDGSSSGLHCILCGATSDRHVV